MNGNSNHQKQQELISQFRLEIVADLDVQHVLPDLLSDLVITYDDKQRIECEKTTEDRADRLLIILEDKVLKLNNQKALTSFINSLQKKYYWLYAKLTQEDVVDSRPIKIVEDTIKEDEVFDSLKHQKIKNLLEAGGVQCLPAVAVERRCLLEEIRVELRSMRRNQYLVIQGMAGCGKSVLATQSINSASLITTLYQDGIYWLAIGKECSESKDALLAKMRILCDKLSESRAPNSLEHGAELLRNAFFKRSEALLVLDDVWRSEVIRAFDVGCRVLVTTRDVSVMDVVNGRVKIIRVGNGFTEAESLQLFCQALRLPTVEALPTEARGIHLECKGSPMVISLISALLQDHESSDTGRWKYYLESLAKRKYSKMRRSRGYEHETIVDAISLSIESLSEINKKYYEDFALFQDDVGIPCSVLMVLWKLQKYEVEDIMKDFVRKSLAVDEFDPQNKSYIYSIHDLQLDYLKYQLLSEENLEKKLHQKLIERYRVLCNGEFHKLPDDGYIYFHLGYHLYKSGLHNYFSRIYLDLLFIGEKMRVTGPADLLVDLRKYLDFIVGDNVERLKFVEEVQTFAQLVGHRIYGQLDVDVIQVALQSPHLLRVHEQACVLAQGSTNRLYLEWKNAKSGQWKHPESTVLCSDHVYCVKFVGTGGSHFIAALSNGYIQLCDLESTAVCHVFSGHTDAVHSLHVFQCNFPKRNNCNHNHCGSSAQQEKLLFLSASADKTCKLWNLQPVLQDAELKTTELRSGRLLGTSPSPKLRPDQWAFDQPRDDSYLTFGFHTALVSHAEFSIDGSRVVSTSVNEILIWDSSNGQILSKISPYFLAYPNLTFQTCHFSPENLSTFLLCTAENQVVLLSPERSSIYAGVEGHNMRIVELLFLSDSSFCTVSENEIGMWVVLKTLSKAKSTRSRSLSPRKGSSQSLRNRNNVVDSAKMVPCKENFPFENFGNFLKPSDIRNGWMSEHMLDLDKMTKCGRKSPAAKSDCFVSLPTAVTTKIDNGTFTVQVLREDILPRKAQGLFLCAATACTIDGQLLACGTSDHKIILWELENRHFLGEFSSHNGWVTGLDFSAVDYCTLLSGSEDHTVMVWDVEEEEKGLKEPQKNPLFSSVYIDSSHCHGYFMSLFFTDRNTLQVYRDYKRVGETQAMDEDITVVCISDDGKYGAAGTGSGRVLQVKDLFGERRCQNKTEVDSVDLEFIGAHESSVKCLQFNQSSQILVSGSVTGSVLIFKDFNLHRKLDGCCDSILQFYFPLGKPILIACAQDASVKIMNTEDGNELTNWKVSRKVHVTCSEFSPKSAFVALGTIEDGIILLSIAADCGVTDKILPSHHKTPIRTLAFNFDGTKLAVGNDNGLITIWCLLTEPFKEESDLILHKSWVRNMIFSSPSAGESKWLISCGDKLAFWSLDKPEEKIRKSSFMAERRRRRSGESSGKCNSNRLSLEIPDGSKIGRQGKRELLQQFAFRGNYAQRVVSDTSFTTFVTVDDTGIFYFLEIMKSSA